jgi:phosphoribosylamine--glycine ligase
MNILIIGSSDGAYTLSQLLLNDPAVTAVYHCSGSEKNKVDRYFPIQVNEDDSKESQKNTLLSLVDIPNLDLIIVTALLYMLFKELNKKIKEKNIPCFAPNLEFAELEWSKIKSKALLKNLGIPTPDYNIYSADEFKEKFLSISRPFVFKYEKEDRAGQQTVIVTDSNYIEEYNYLIKEGHNRFHIDLYGPFKDQKFIVEEFIEGSREYSYHAISNSVNWRYLGTARDYKKMYNNDTGFNTTGIGAYAPVDINPLVHTYADKILKHCQNYTGILYLGIIEDKDGIPYVLEINTRPGNPELQVIFPLVQNNLANLFYLAATQQLIPAVTFKNLAASCVRIVTRDYKPSKSPLIPINIEKANQENIHISELPNEGNRINCTLWTTADSVNAASDKIYKIIDNIEMHEFTYRTDIGYLK